MGAFAAENISGTSVDSLSTLGFDTDASEVISDADSGTTPTGNTAYAMYTQPELLTTVKGASLPANMSTGTSVYDYEKKADLLGVKVRGLNFTTSSSGDNDNSPLLLFPASKTKYALPTTATYTYMSSVAFDPTGSGKDDHVARVCALVENSVTTFTLYVTAYDGTTTAYGLGAAPFIVQPNQARAYTPVAAGDFDGDGYDELAVYNFSGPIAGEQWGTFMYDGGSTLLDDDAELDIRILNVDPATLVITEAQLETTDASGTRPAEYNLSELGFSKTGVDDSNQSRANKLYYPIVDLTTVEQPGDQYDDLVICVSHALYSTTYVVDAATRMVFWQDPGNSNAADNAMQTFAGVWYWGADYGLSNTSDAEMMAFGGAGAANLDGDSKGYNEVVVAGLRFKHPNVHETYDDTFKLDDTNNNTSLYLTAVFTYDSTARQYTRGVATWINVDDGTYNDSTNMRECIRDDYDDRQIAYDPFKVVGFAEKGNGYADSVFINGFVCDYYTSESGSVASLPYGFSTSMKNAGASKNGNKFLYVTYAVPINYIGYESGSRDGQTDVYMRWIGDAVAGNFDGDVNGIEELMFVYGSYNEDYETSCATIAVQKMLPGKLSNASDLYDGSLKINEDSSIYNEHDTNKSKNYTFTANDCWIEKSSQFISLAAIDWDDDSVIARPDPERAPEYYFSDPNVVAVLQSAPYFEELSADYDFYPANGATTIAKETGSSGETTAGIDVSAGVIVGVNSEVSAGLIFNHKIGEVESLFTVSFHYSFEYATETEKSYSTEYSASVGTDMVVLTMTPYVRYYYQVWDGVNWTEMTIDMPKTPRTTMVSVDTYDNVATANGWDVIRGNILNSTPGNPATYDSTSSGLDSFDGGKTIGGNSGNDWVGVGTGGTSSVGNITQSISSSTTDSYTVSGGLGIENESTVVVGIVKTGFTGSIEATAGHTWTKFTGTTFSGTVDNLPEGAAAGYDFLWRFGCWEDQLSYTNSDGRTQKSNVYVLGYLVKEPQSLPKPPQDLSVVNFTEDSITLEWTHPASIPVKYIIYREEAGGYVPLAIVKADSSSDTQQYIDTTCESGTTYNYRIVSVNYLNGFETKGPNSPVATGTTLSPSVPKVSIVGDVTVQAGDDATFTAIITPVAGGGPTAIQWQKWDGGAYVDLGGETQTTYTIPRAALNKDGNRYRCYVTQLVHGYWRAGYSTFATLHVTQRATETTLSDLQVSSGYCSYYNSKGVKQPGTAFNFEATVVEANGGTRVPTGNVEFDIVNKSTGSHYTLVGKLSGNTATASFEPSESGDYRVAVTYRGDELFATSASDSADFLVYSSAGKVLVVEGAESITYGDTMGLKTKLLSDDGTSTYIDNSEVTYKATDDASIASSSNLVDIANATFDPVAASKLLYPKRNYTAATGGYIIQATCTVGGISYSATKCVEVNKKDVVLKPSDKTMKLADLSSAYLDDVNIEFDSFASVDDEATIAEYKSFFELYTSLPENELFVGTHTVRIRYASAPTSPIALIRYTLYMKQLFANYNVYRMTSELNVEGEWYTVKYEAVGNGDVAATTENRAPLASEDTVLKGTKLTFSAAPATGSAIEGWKVDGSQLASAGLGTMLGAIDKDTTVVVTFDVQYVGLAWSVNGTGGTISAALGISPLSGSSAQVAADGRYVFTAKPDAGKMVAKWTVNGVEQPTRDTTLVINSPVVDTTVQVSYEDALTHVVKAEGIDTSGAARGSVTITPAPSSANELADGVAVKFTAVVPIGFKVAQWRSYAPDGTYAILQYDVDSYSVAALSSDLDIKVVFAPQVKYSISWQAVGSGTISAINTSTNTALTSGGYYGAGIPITFSVKPSAKHATQSVVAKTSAGEQALTLVSTSESGEETYVLDILSENTVVTATFVPTATATIELTGGPGAASAYLNWNVTLAGDPEINGYSIYRKSGTDDYSLIGTTDKATYAYADSGLVNGTEYMYKVVATTGMGDEFASNELAITPAASNWYRLWGAGRLDTMQKIVGFDTNAPYSYGNAFESGRGGYAIVATSTGYWDALSAAGLAGLLDAPVLLTNPTELSTQTRDAIESLGCTDIIVAGGSAAVSETVLNELKGIKGINKVERVWGATATETATAIFRYGENINDGWGNQAFVVTRNGYYDALSAGPYSYSRKAPIFLTEASSNTLSSDSLAAIQGTFGEKSVIIVGGPAAVSASVETQLGSTFQLREFGANRYETSIALATWEIGSGMNADRIGVATGDNFPDALCGAALCGKYNSVLILVSDTDRSTIGAIVVPHKSEIAVGYIFGGTKAVSGETEQALVAATS